MPWCCVEPNSDDFDDSAVLALLGLDAPLPPRCCANENVRKQTQNLPPELLSLFADADRASLGRAKLKKLSNGWHEGYGISTSKPVLGKRQFFLRVWHGELSYWRLEVPISRAVEFRAIELAAVAGLHTAPLLRTEDGTLCAGRTVRGDEAECEWCCFEWVERMPRAADRRVGAAGEAADRTALLQQMTTLHSLDLTRRDTAPLARFDSAAEHLAYVTHLAEQSRNSRAIAAAAAVARVMADDGALSRPLPPALCHYDWHFGNVLHSAEGLVTIDWEFSGVADPRLDLARFCKRRRWTGDVRPREKGSDAQTDEIWRECDDASRTRARSFFGNTSRSPLS